MNQPREGVEFRARRTMGASRDAGQAIDRTTGREADRLVVLRTAERPGPPAHAERVGAMARQTVANTARGPQGLRKVVRSVLAFL